ncbi:phosphoglycolate phosphatase-like HAD superfamily hydrolase [Streptomyces sp. 846.5]|nr:haloacid dehalogenase-like hydrolase [Streptomyces sp. 846.5]TDT97309.1 phosphoglycolate phosphatase-like HAD superfamily hydrolase [Streptomyces sp. 846.5]
MTGYRLVLWDVDHTLIASGGVGGEISARAFQKVTGRRQEHHPDVSGRTERAILAESCRLHGLDPGAYRFEDYADALTEGYLRRAGALRERGHALLGAAKALEAVARLDGVRQTVVSGNVRRVAEIKLAVFGLDRHIDFDLGAYAEDSDVRADLVRAAYKRATDGSGLIYGIHALLVIGDTPSDIDAAHQAGAMALGVATGRSGEAELWDAGADATLPSLEDTDLIVAMIRDGLAAHSD